MAEPRDSLGRIRQPGQNRGLRPRFPRLPERWLSRVVRLAMPRSDWEQFDAYVAGMQRRGVTEARARGLVLSELLRRELRVAATSQAPAEWMDWEARKADRLLFRAGDSVRSAS